MLFKHLWRQFTTLLSVNYAHMVEYRAELLFWVLSNSLPIILMGVWYQAAQGGGFALSPIEFTRYFLAVFIVRQFTIVWVIWEFEDELVQGRLSPRLLQPIDPVWHHLTSHIAERGARLPFGVILVVFFFVLYPTAFWIPSFKDVLLAGLSITLAFALRFTVQYTFAMVAFWTERAAALEQIWFGLYLFLSGMIAPLEVFPPAMRQILVWTPFPYLIDVPANILVGLPVNIGQSYWIPLGWLVLSFLLNRWLWRQGLKQYSGMGA